MVKTIHPSKIKGSIIAPPSKSLTQRAIAAALMSRGTSDIISPSYCSDSLAALKIVTKLGAKVVEDKKGFRISGSSEAVAGQILNCGESGLAMRMFSPVAAMLTSSTTFTGEGSLLKRPVSMISDALRQSGITIVSSEGYLPLTLTGRLLGGRYEIDGSTGSQLLTGLLIALPLADCDSEIIVHDLKSKPYISLTIKLMNDFGITVENFNFRRFFIPGRQAYNAREYVIEGDWSGAAFLLVAGLTCGEVTVDNLSTDSKQADVAVMKAFHKAGARIDVIANRVKAKKGELMPFDFDATQCPDLFPPLACLAVNCMGTSRIKGVSRLEHKESNRALAIVQVLQTMGVEVSIHDDVMNVKGGPVVGNAVSSHNDHRIAMMASIAALSGSGYTRISIAEAVKKSYPDFFDNLITLGARIN